MLSRIVRFLFSASRAWGTRCDETDESRVIENGRQAISRGEFRLAEDLLTQIPNQPIRHIEVLHLLGIVFNRTGRSGRAAEILSSARELAPDHEGVFRQLAIARLAQCDLGGHLRQALDVLSARLDSAAPTAEVQTLLEACMSMPGRGDLPATARSEIGFLLGVALLSLGEDCAELCSRALRGAEEPGSEYIEFDLRTPIIEYCRKLGLPWKAFDDVRLGAIRRDPDPAAPAITSFVCALPDGMVLGTSFIPATQTGHAFAEQCIHNPDKLQWKNAAEVLDMVRLACRSRLLASSSGTDHYEGRHLLIGNSENFAHWLLNHLPRLRLAEEMPALRDASVVVGEDIRPSHLQCLMRAGIAAENIVYLRRGRIATFGELWVPSLLFCGISGGRGIGSELYWSSELLSFIRRRLKLDFSATPTRRIFSSRKTARWRRLLNEAEVVAMLDRFGFEAVDPGAMSLDEQIRLAAESQIIVGPLGAGIYFFLLAPEGTPVVELKYDTKGVMDFNWALAEALHQPHHVIIGESQPTDPDILKRDFTVLPERVREVVERALDSLGPRK